MTTTIRKQTVVFDDEDINDNEEIVTNNSGDNDQQQDSPKEEDEFARSGSFRNLLSKIEDEAKQHQQEMNRDLHLDENGNPTEMGTQQQENKKVRRIRFSIDDLRDIKKICDEFGEIELDDFIEHFGPIARRQNRDITAKDLALLFEFIDANDSKGVDWDEISMFLIRNDEMEEKRLTAQEITKFDQVEGITHPSLPQFDTQLKMLQHKFPVKKILSHPRLPLLYSASMRELKIWKTDQLRHVRTPFVNSKHDIVTSISLCPNWDDSILITCYDSTISLYHAQTGDLQQIFVSERGAGNGTGRNGASRGATSERSRSGTGRRMVSREIFSVPWTEQEARQLRSDMGGKAALCGTIASHDPLLGHLNPPKSEESTILYDLCFVNPKAAALLPPHMSRRSSFPTCADVFISPMTNTHKLAVGLSTGHVQVYDIENCRRVDGSSPVGIKCETIVKMHEGRVQNLRVSQALGALISSGGDDGIIHIRNLERVDLRLPTSTLGQGIPLLDSRYSVAGQSSRTLHEHDVSRYGHAHGIIDIDIHEKHRLLISCAESESDPLLWSPFIPKPLARLECSKRGFCIGVSFNQLEPHVTCLTSDGIVRVFDVRTLRCLQQFDASVNQSLYHGVSSSNASKQTKEQQQNGGGGKGSKDQNDDCFPDSQAWRPTVIAVDSAKCRAVTGLEQLYSYPIVSSDRKDLIEGHSTSILGTCVVNRSGLNFLSTFDNNDVCVWDKNGTLVVRWEQSSAGLKNPSALKKEDEGKNGNTNNNSNEGNNNSIIGSSSSSSPASAAAINLDAGLTGAVASVHRKIELACGCMDTNERRLFIASADGRVDIVNMMNGYPLKRLLPPDALELNAMTRRRDLERDRTSKPNRGSSPDEQHPSGRISSSALEIQKVDSITHKGKDVDRLERNNAEDIERRNRLGLSDDNTSRLLHSAAGKIRAARKALGEVSAISFGEQSIPREGGLAAVTFSSGYVALYVDEQNAPSVPQRILRAKEPIYSVCVFPPSFVALGLAGRIAVHTLEEVGDRLTYLEPLSKDQLTHNSLFAAIVPGPLLNDPRNSSTVNITLPPPDKILTRQGTTLHHQNQQQSPNSRSGGNLLSSFFIRKDSRRNLTSTNSTGHLSSANSSDHQQVHHTTTRQSEVSSVVPPSSVGGATTNSTVTNDGGLAKFSADRQQMMTIVECLVAVHIGRSEPTLLSGTGAGTIHVWDVRRQVECQRFLASVGFGEAVTALSLHPTTHDQLAVGDACGYVTILDIRNLGARDRIDIAAKSILLNAAVRDQVKVISRFRAHEASVSTISLSAANYVISAAADTIALRFSYDGTMLRCFGKYFGKEGFLSPTNWVGVSHHPVALASYDVVRARVIARILDAVGPQTKEQIYAQCYYVEGNKKVELDEYSPRELEEVNKRIRKDETGRIVYRQPPPKSSFFSILYYEDNNHEILIDRLLHMMVEGINFGGSASAQNNNSNNNNSHHQTAVKKGQRNVLSANNNTEGNNPSAVVVSSVGIAPPRLLFNKQNQTYFRPPKHQVYQANTNSSYIKRSVVEFALPTADEDENAEQQQQHSPLRNKAEHQPLLDVTVTSSNTGQTASLKTRDLSPLTEDLNLDPHQDTKPTQLQSQQTSVQQSGFSPLIGGKAKAPIDVTAMIQKSGFFDESDDDEGPLRRPVPPRHVAKMNNPSAGVATLSHALLLSSPERFMTVAPLTEEQVREKKARDRVMQLALKAKTAAIFGELFSQKTAYQERSFEIATKETILIASELFEEQKKEKEKEQKEQQDLYDRAFEEQKNRIPKFNLSKISGGSQSSKSKEELAQKNPEQQQQINSEGDDLKRQLSFMSALHIVKNRKLHPSLYPQQQQSAHENDTRTAQTARVERSKDPKLARGEGLTIATEWRQFLEGDDRNTMVHGVTPRNVWLRDTVRTRPEEMLSCRGLAGSFDMNLHLKEEARQERLRRRELGLRLSDIDEDNVFADENGTKSGNSSPKSGKGSRKMSSLSNTAGSGTMYQNRTVTGRSMFRSFRRHNFGSHLLEGSDRHKMKRNPLDGPTGGVAFSDLSRPDKEIIPGVVLSKKGSFPPHHQQNLNVKIPVPPKKQNEEKQVEEEEKQQNHEIESDVSSEREEFDNMTENETGKKNHQESTTTNTLGQEPSMDQDTFILHSRGGEKIRLPFAKLSRLLMEAQMHKEEEEQKLRVEQAKAEKALERQSKRQAKRNKKAKFTQNVAGAGINSDGDDEDDSNSDSGTTVTSTSFSEEENETSNSNNNLLSSDSESAAGRRLESPKRKKRSKRHRRGGDRSKKEKEKPDYEKMGWAAKIKALMDGELRILANKPGHEIPPEAFFPPKDNAHVIANILSKWHVERVERERPPAAGLHGVSAAVLSSSSTAGSKTTVAAATLPKRAALEEKEIVGDWGRFNREGVARPGYK